MKIQSDLMREHERWEKSPPACGSTGPKVTVCFFVDLPEQEDRKDILSIHVTGRKRDPLAEGLITEELLEATDGFSGAELEQVVIDGLFSAFAEGKVPLRGEHLLAAARKTVPLSTTMEQQIDALRKWSVGRAMQASISRRVEQTNGSTRQRLVLP